MVRRVPSLRRIGSGMSMILAPLLWFASSALGPGHEASHNLAGVLPHIATDPDRFLASVLSGLGSLVLLVPAVLGVGHLLHRRSPLLALAGTALVLVGILSLAVLHGVQLVQYQMIHATADRGQMIALLQRLEGGIGPKVIFVGLFLRPVPRLGHLVGRFTRDAVRTEGDTPFRSRLPRAQLHRSREALPAPLPDRAGLARSPRIGHGGRPLGVRRKQRTAAELLNGCVPPGHGRARPST